MQEWALYLRNARIHLKAIKIRKPGSGPKTVFAPWVTYSPLTDTLLLYFYGGPEPAINVNIEGGSAYAMVDPDTDEFVGVHIQAFTKRFLPEHPHVRDTRAVEHLLSERHEESEVSVGDSGAQKALAAMIVGSLMLEHGLVAT